MTQKPAARVDVLVVGAGPTGLTLASQLRAWGAAVRIVDRRPGPFRPSRALVMQPRTLEVLRTLGVAGEVVEQGDPAPIVHLHAGAREVAVPALGDGRLEGTPYPFLLMVRQSDVERVLTGQLRSQGVEVDWGTELTSFQQDRHGVTGQLRRAATSEELRLESSYLVGCDGASSTVRQLAGIPFAGRTYAESALLADLDLDGAIPKGGHFFVGRHGLLMLLPVGEHARWRLVTVLKPQDGVTAEALAGSPDRLCAYASTATRGWLESCRVAWAGAVRLQLRLAESYCRGRVLLAGDAAHVNSPAGAQGMNTGMQDACNLGWKLALAARGLGAPELLDSFGTERRAAARTVLAVTHLAFLAESGGGFVGRGARARLAPLAAPVLARYPRLVRPALRVLSQLDLSYPRGTVAVEGTPRVKGGIPAGGRVPDVRLTGTRRLHDLLSERGLHLLLRGPEREWSREDLAALRGDLCDLLHVHHVAPDGPRDPFGDPPTVQYLVRPDGYVAYRAGGADLDGLRHQLRRWLSGAARSASEPPAPTSR